MLRCAVLVMAMIATFVIGLGEPTLVTLPLLVVPVLLGSSFLTLRATTVLAGLALLMAIASGFAAPHAWGPNDWLWLVSMALVGLLAINTARLRERSEDARSAAERGRAAADAHYRLLAENASDVVYSAGLDRLVTWVSPTVAKILGWTPDELIGTVMADLVHPVDREATEDVRARVYAGRHIENPERGFVVRMRTKAGDYRWMSNAITTVTDDPGNATGMIGALTLVEELVAARADAQAKEQRLQALLDSMLEPVVLLTAVRDASGTVADFVFTDANPAALDAYGMTGQELLGMSLDAINPAARRAGLFDMYERVIERGEPLILDDWAYPEPGSNGRVSRYDIRAMKVGDAVSETWRDVTDRYVAVQRVAESEERFRLLAQNSTDIVFQSDGGVIQWVSPSLLRVLGWAADEWVGHRSTEFIHPDDWVVMAERRREVEAGASSVVRVRVRARLGAYHWVELHAGPFVNGRGERQGLIGSFRIVDAEVAAQQLLERQARFDDLTGTLKRDPALDRLHDAARRPRTPGSETAVLFIDLDDFKLINDRWGHLAGDAVLKSFAERIRSSVRTGDTVARMGGDEFLVLLAAVHGMDDALAVAEKIRARCAEPVMAPEGAVSATISVGVTLVNPVESGDAIIARADRGMYQAKDHGRNTVIPIDPAA